MRSSVLCFIYIIITSLCACSEEANAKDIKSRRKREWLRTIKLFWFFFFVYYPSLCSAVFRMYSCTEVQGEWLMTADMTIACRCVDFVFTLCV
jgi:hypothetical protein